MERENSVGAGEHFYEMVHFNRPTWCDECRGFFASPIGKQGLRCRLCSKTAHAKCLATARSRLCGAGDSGGRGGGGDDQKDGGSSTKAGDPSTTVRALSLEQEAAAFDGALPAVRSGWLVDDVLLAVLGWLPPSSVAACMRCCHRFRRVGQHPEVFAGAAVDLSESALALSPSSALLPQLLRRLARVRSLSLRSCVRLGEEGLAVAAQSLRSIESLDLSYCSVYVTATLLRSAVLPPLTSLRSLNLSFTAAASSAALAEYGSVLPTILTALRLHGFHFSEAEDEERPVPSVRFGSALQALAVRCVSLAVLAMGQQSHEEEGDEDDASRTDGEVGHVQASELAPLGLFSSCLTSLQLPSANYHGDWPVAKLKRLRGLRRFHVARSGSLPPPLERLGWDALEDISVNAVTKSLMEWVSTLPSLRAIHIFGRFNQYPAPPGIRAPSQSDLLHALRRHADTLESMAVPLGRFYWPETVPEVLAKPPAVLAALVAGMSRLQKLIVRQYTPKDADLAALIASCGRSLRRSASHRADHLIDAADFRDSVAGVLTATSVRPSTIRRIDSGDWCIDSHQFQDKGLRPLRHLVPAGAAWPELRDFGMCGNFDDMASCRRLASAMPKLQHLHTYSTKELRWAAISAVGARFTSMTRLNLDNATPALLQLATAACPQLPELAIETRYLRKGGGDGRRGRRRDEEMLVESDATLLAAADAAENDETPMSLAVFEPLLKHWSRLVSLRIRIGYHWHFDDAHCAAIGRHCPHLRRLSMFTPRMSASVAEGVEHHRITSKGLDAIIAGCPLLLELSFDSCKVKQLPTSLAPHTHVSGWVRPDTREAEQDRVKHAHVGTHGGPCVVQ